eukprot:m.3860 g.3860  ORF g.3860 m.3860 type:complete len:116 (+) comp4527_c0_seq1:24-371(+)
MFVLSVPNPDFFLPCFRVLLADFGLSKDTHYLDYYRCTGETLLPVRWMAPESLLDGTFNASTDVWAFGVVMWEIFSMGRTPYPTLTNDQVFKKSDCGLLHGTSGLRSYANLQYHA